MIEAMLGMSLDPHSATAIQNDIFFFWFLVAFAICLLRSFSVVPS
jgi:hypothetical protein